MSCRHVAQGDDGSLKFFDASGFEHEGLEKTAVDAKTVMALANTRRVLYNEITALLFEDTILLIELIDM